MPGVLGIPELMRSRSHPGGSHPSPKIPWPGAKGAKKVKDRGKGRTRSLRGEQERWLQKMEQNSRESQPHLAAGEAEGSAEPRASRSCSKGFKSPISSQVFKHPRVWRLGEVEFLLFPAGKSLEQKIPGINCFLPRNIHNFSSLSGQLSRMTPVLGIGADPRFQRSTP